MALQQLQAGTKLRRVVGRRSCLEERRKAGPAFASSSNGRDRVARVQRTTKEVGVSVRVRLDGSGTAANETGIPFLNHMLDQIASHSLMDVEVRADGDTEIDSHHTTEDVALALGEAMTQALGDRKGICRFGDFTAPLDEALLRAVLDLSGRPHLSFNCAIPNERIGSFETEMVEHFFQSVANTAGITLHIDQIRGWNSHHIVEASFKAFARALRQAIEFDQRRLGEIPSSKGALTQN